MAPMDFVSIMVGGRLALVVGRTARLLRRAYARVTPARRCARGDGVGTRGSGAGQQVASGRGRSAQAGGRIDAGAARQGAADTARYVPVARGTGAEREPLVISRPGENFVRGVSAADRRNAEEGRPAAHAGRTRAARSLLATLRTDHRARLDGHDAVPGAADARGSGTLGRNAAAPRRRDRRHAATVRLRRADRRADRQRSPPARSHRPPARPQADRRRRESAARGVSGCSGLRRRRNAHA